MAKNTVTREIILTDVRLSFADLFKARVIGTDPQQKQEPKFRASFLLDTKEHAQQIQTVINLLTEIKKEAFPGYNGTLKHQPLRNGNEKPDTEGYGDGVMFISASSTRRPVVVNRAKVPVQEGDKEAPYSGCFVDAKIQFWSQVFGGGRQINASLVAVRFVRDGEAFSGVNFDASEFRDLESEGNTGVAADGSLDNFTL